MDDDLDLDIPMDDEVGPGVYVGVPEPPRLTRRLTTVSLPRYPGTGKGSPPKIIIDITHGQDLNLDVTVEGKVCTQEEYYAVIDLIKSMV